MNIFDCAITIEQKAKAYYEQLEQACTVPAQKHLFHLLAAAEQQHIESLVDMKEVLAARGAEVEAAVDEAGGMRLFDKEDATQEMKSDPDLFLHAVQEEEQDIRYYEDLAARVEDSGVRLNLLLIAEEERKHLEIVENIYSYAEAPRSYLVTPEYTAFSNLEEL